MQVVLILQGGRCDSAMHPVESNIDQFSVILFVLVTFLPSGRGKYPRLMLNGYTYKRVLTSIDGATLWYCSSRGNGCRAIVKSQNNVYQPAGLVHSHVAPIYHKTKNGDWIRASYKLNKLER
ncbi:hypothetical protein EVAR_9207_1 [Eumeta japonica]|uniref:FLYWCH-type domain-containing protein n=1 Tax=Eumeta variegata TaxID=151549 RepID=A0A4C1WQA5_EUMVA|nr:hypothetical protein EVAR_9207_1 [Eumeta japonica]